jgi:DNA-binding HxlR family transcriptional regulator
MRRNGYGQYCPVARAAEILTERWTPLILRELLAGSHRFNELRRGVPLMSPTLLSDRLQRLERTGLIRRTRASGRGHSEYHLTEAGEACRPLIDLMAVWGRRWAMGRLSREDLDPALMLWFILRKARVQDRLPESRVTIRFDIADAPQGKRYWWIVFDAPEVDLCLSDPGFVVDLTWQSDARAIAAVLLGETSIERASRTGVITLEGPARLRRYLSLILAQESRRPTVRLNTSAPSRESTGSLMK